MTYPVKLAVTVSPIWHVDAPEIQIGINDNLTPVKLTETTVFEFEFLADKDSELTIEFLNKIESDTVPNLNLDKAVVVETVSFFNISDPKFVWAGIYDPKYPEPWATEQKNQNIVLPNELKYHNYLGWNGVWRLQFTVPVFTWIHQIQDLGWIYK
jgi:hypothetical protein